MRIKKYLPASFLFIALPALVFYIIIGRTFLSMVLEANYLKQSIPSLDEAESFSVIVLPDTQLYSANYPNIFCGQTGWIVANQKRLNI